jgi:hypothetical protein
MTMKPFIQIFIFALMLTGIMANAQATQQYMDAYQAPACTSCHTSGILNRSTGQAGLSAYLAAKTPTCTTPQVLQGNVCVTPVAGDSDRIFTYLESIYPGYLAPTGSASSNFSGYYYRYYSATNAYIATANETVYYMGSASQNQIISLGAQADWLAKAVAAGY